MTFRAGGAEIRITFAAVLFWAFCLVAGEGKPLLWAAVALCVHESAHAVAANNLGCSVTRVTVWPFGAVMRLDRLFLCERTERIVSIAGPLGSLAAAGALRLFQPLLPEGEWTGALVRSNLLIAGINLLPAFPLDGGRVFRSLLLRFLRERTAKIILLSFTAAIACGAVGTGAYLLCRGVPAWTLFAIPPFLMLSAVSEWRQPDVGIVSRVMQRSDALKSGEPQRAILVVLPENATVRDAVSALSRSQYTVLRVMRGDGFREIGEEALFAAAAKFGMETPLKTVTLRLTAGK